MELETKKKKFQPTNDVLPRDEVATGFVGASSAPSNTITTIKHPIPMLSLVHTYDPDDCIVLSKRALAALAKENPAAPYHHPEKN